MPTLTLSVSPPPAQAKPFDVVCVGESSLDLVAVVDRIPELDSKGTAASFDTLPGGQAATAAVACARQGWRSRYIGCLGDDAWGDAIAAALIREHVDLGVVRRADARSRTALITVERSTGRRSVLECRDPRQQLRAEDIDAAAATSGRLLLVDATDVDASALAARAARAVGIPTVVDVDRSGPGVDELLAAIDVLIVSASFAAEHSADPASGLIRLSERFRPAVAIATLGARGSVALCRGREIWTAAPEVPVIDTTGAGDAFRGGFIAAWLRFGAGADVEVLLRYANATAALNCRSLGAQTALPGQELVDALVTRSYGVQSK